MNHHTWILYHYNHFISRKWTSRLKFWNTSGIQSWRSTASTPLAGRECWRKCPGWGSTRTRRSLTSSGSGSQSPAGWTLIITPWMRRLVSSKWGAVSILSDEYNVRLMITQSSRLRHPRDRHLHLPLHLRPRETALTSALSTDRGAAS